MNRKKILRFRTYTKALLLSSMIAIVSCEQDSPLEDQEINPSGMSEAVMNPYSVDVMQAALDQLSENTAFNTAGIDVIENHQYIRFEMPLEVPAEELELQIDLYDYPVLSSPDEGEEVISSEPSAYYAIIPLGATPPGDYTVLSSLYLPTVLETSAREQDLVLLEKKAYELAGWLPDEKSEENGGRINFDLFDNWKWRPGGKVVGEGGLGGIFPIKGIKVNMKRAGQSWAMSGKTSYTDNDGKFKWKGDRPIGLVRYRFNIDKYEGSRKIFARQKVGFVDLDINGLMYASSNVLPYQHNKLSGGQFNVTLSKQATRYYLLRESHKKFVKDNDLPFEENKPTIRVLEFETFKGEGGGEPSVVEVRGNKYFINESMVYSRFLHYIFFYHEMEHGFNLTGEMERGVATAMSRIRDPNGAGSSDGYSHIAKVFLDLIDDDSDPNPFGYDHPKDQVSGYTVKQLMESLKNIQTFSEWRDKLVADANSPEEAEKIRELMKRWN